MKSADDSPGDGIQGKKERRESGFTLIEVLVVTAIIGILAAMALVSLLNALEKAKQRSVMGDMRTISKAISTYQIDLGYYPAAGTMAQVAAVLIPYQTNVLPIKDHWSHSYDYTTDGVTGYTIESFGKDGIDGTDISLATRWNFDYDIVLSDGMFTASPER